MGLTTTTAPDWGLTTASDKFSTMNQAGRYAKPAWYGGQMQLPKAEDYYQQAPAARYETPQYKGLMGGDWDALQQAISAPGARQINEGYDKAAASLNEIMGGAGLYGSSLQRDDFLDIEDRRAAQLADNAANAAVQRYGMQTEDLARQNQFGLTTAGARYASDLAQQERGDIYSRGLMERKDAITGMRNDLIREQNAYQQMQTESQRAVDEMLFNQALAIATGALPGFSANQSYQASIDAAREARTPGVTDYISTGAGALGALFGKDAGATSAWEVIKDLWPF